MAAFSGEHEMAAFSGGREVAEHPPVSKDSLEVVLATDCGSTTTKALLFERTPAGWRQTFRGEAPTTVERPVADVTVGARNAFREVEELSGRKILADTGLESAPPFLNRDRSHPETGIDLYLSTSSAGGGLQMVVTGIAREMSAESAERAALGGGAIVLDVVCADDGREDFERIDRLRHLKPDIVLMAGGTDGGSRQHPVEIAELIVAAAPRPRFGNTLRLPIIYAGNADAAAEVQEILSRIGEVTVVPNLRPVLEREALHAAREAVHDIFLTHVMSHSPGYDKLLGWTPVPVLPTPSAVGDMISRYAMDTDAQVLCADIGGATTDVFSVFKNAQRSPVYNRTVSANLGMSYSVANVLVEAGVEGIRRWLPVPIADHELRDRLRNKMIRPTTIPQTKEDLWIEQAVCREALRLSLTHHRALAVGLSGVQQQRGISEIFAQKRNRVDLVDLTALEMVIGSGGVLSHAPQRIAAALMMLEGFGLEGVTELAVDSIFMLPHLGVLSSVHPEAAKEIFEHDCLIRLGFGIVPIYPKWLRHGAALATINLREGGTTLVEGTIRAGEFSRLPVTAPCRGVLTVTPAARDIEVGAGPGQPWVREVFCGECGLLLDGRNRPLEFPSVEEVRIRGRRTVMQVCGLAE